MSFTIRRLNAVASYLKHSPLRWTTKVMKVKEVEELGLLDPPCQLLVLECGPFRLWVDADGEITAWMNEHQCYVGLLDEDIESSSLIAHAITVLTENFSEEGDP